MRKSLRPQVVTFPELAQYRQQRAARQGVDLVDQQHQRRRVRRRPAHQGLAQGGRPEFGGDPRPVSRQEQVAQRRPRAGGEPRQDDAGRALHVVPHRLSAFHVGVYAAVGAAGAAVEQVAERAEGGGLAALARRVQHEVLLLPDQQQHLVQVETVQRRDAVVPVRLYRSGGVEVGDARVGGGGWRVHYRSLRALILSPPRRGRQIRWRAHRRRTAAPGRCAARVEPPAPG